MVFGVPVVTTFGGKDWSPPTLFSRFPTLISNLLSQRLQQGNVNFLLLNYYYLCKKLHCIFIVTGQKWISTENLSEWFRYHHHEWLRTDNILLRRAHINLSEYSGEINPPILNFTPTHPTPPHPTPPHPNPTQPNPTQPNRGKAKRNF